MFNVRELNSTMKNFPPYHPSPHVGSKLSCEKKEEYMKNSKKFIRKR